MLPRLTSHEVEVIRAFLTELAGEVNPTGPTALVHGDLSGEHILWEAMRPRWRSEKTVRSWMQQMERHVFPVIGDLRVDQVRREDVLGVLDPLWNTIPAAG